MHWFTGWALTGLLLSPGIVSQTVVARTESEVSCTTRNGGAGFCVYQYQCNEGMISEWGENIIDLRQAKEDCNNYLMKCCAIPTESTTLASVNEEEDDYQESIFSSSSVSPISDVKVANETAKDPKQTGTAKPTQPKPKQPGAANESRHEPKRPPLQIPPYEREGCGHRNPRGVIFKIENNEFSESEYGEYPWVVAIFARTNEGSLKYICGGALIDRAAVLTTASCLYPYRKNVSSLVVRLGEWDMSTQDEPIPHIDSEMEKIILHPVYGMTTKINDIAVVILRDTIELNHTVDVVCLPRASSEPLSSAYVTGVGWGDVPTFVEPVKLPQTILKKTQLNYLSHEQCQQILLKLMGRRYKLHPSFRCSTAQESEMLPCSGDSGSPYVSEVKHGIERYELVGLSSWGYDCNKQNAPTVLTNVAYHRNWIDEVIKAEDLNIWSYTYEEEQSEQSSNDDE